MPAVYNGSDFDTRLQATWAAFFDLAGWQWRKDITAIGDWKPDFEASFECNHSECSGSHKILISVLPIGSITGVTGHPAFSHGYGVENSNGKFVAHAGAVFGIDPRVTEWVMSHGAGGGTERVTEWVHDAFIKWRDAERIVSEEN